MKRLIILRHAKSSLANMTLSDFDRPLSETGIISAQNIADFINAKESNVNLIITSAAKRARQTAEIIAKTINYDVNKIDTQRALYLACVEETLKSISQIDDHIDKCIIVGHNPGLTELINYYGVRLDNLPTSSAACFEFDAKSWQDISPDNANMLWFQLAKYLM